jgi:23S rRNA (cytidine1920-2'-O)/16S rRNA (cytidine1409-2'-O)-methyltransferase
MKVRLDKLLVESGLVSSRERAQALILAGRVLVNEQKIEKAGAQVPEDAAIRVLGQELRYVSRGGLKLEHALAYWKIELAGRSCVDIGTSTGGFTDCMLQHGAAEVFAIDTGYGQIHARLRQDPRVHLIEKTNARFLTAEVLRQGGARDHLSFMAMDVSFISATLVLPALIKAIQEHNRERDSAAQTLDAVILVKPQFEVGRELVGAGGIVRDAIAQQAAVDKVRAAVTELGATPVGVEGSPILGSEGNKEFLLYSKFDQS